MSKTVKKLVFTGFHAAHRNKLPTSTTTFSDSSRHELQLSLGVLSESQYKLVKKINLYFVHFQNDEMSMKNNFFDQLLVESG